MPRLKRKITRTDGNQKFEIWPSGKVRISEIDNEHKHVTIEPTGEITLGELGFATVIAPDGKKTYIHISPGNVFIPKRFEITD